MRLSVRLLATLAGIILATAPLFSQAPQVSTGIPRHEIYLDPVVTDPRISNKSISSICQDSRGFLWIGTQGGLNRYDGYSCVVYENDPYNENSLSHNLIQTMYRDADDVLWIGTYGGLNRFDIQKATFRRFKSDPADDSSLSNNVVIAITRDHQGALWVGTQNGLNRLNEKTGRFERFLPNLETSSSISSNVVRALYDDGRYLWIGTYGGLNRYDQNTGTFTAYRMDKANPKALPSDNIMTILPDESGSLWLGAWGGGLVRFSTADGSCTTTILPDPRTYCLLRDGNELYVGTWGGGLVRYDITTGTQDLYLADPENQFSISHNVVYSLFKDSSGIIWMGTNGGGLQKYNPKRRPVGLIGNMPKDPVHLSRGKITAVAEDRSGAIWIGVDNGGVNRYDPATGTVKTYRHSPTDPKSLSNDVVTSFLTDSGGTLWVGTNDGLDRYDPRTDSFVTYGRTEDGNVEFADQIIYSMAEDEKGNFWIGTYNGGLDYWDRKNNSVAHHPFNSVNPRSLSDNLVYSIFIDRKGLVWIGTNRGLNRYNPMLDDFVHYFHDSKNLLSISSDTARLVTADDAGNLWIGTLDGGLNRYIPEKDGFIHYTRADGLPNNTVQGILADPDGTLWISSNPGLSLFNQKTGKFRVVDEDDGLPTTDFTSGRYRDSRGRHYFGSMMGLVYIDSFDLAENPHIPQIALTGIKIFNEPANLPEPAYMARNFKVDYRQNFFSFEFAALDFASPRKNQYAYKLEGFDHDWIYSGTRRFASYTNLNPGSYVFRVKGTNNKGLWNTEGLALSIRVVPPIWMSWYANLFYLALAIAAIAYVARTLSDRQRRAVQAAQRRLEREKIVLLEQEVSTRRLVEEELVKAKEEAESASRTKGEFLANMSHEIRTPLNSILGYSQIMYRNAADEKNKEYLRIIQNSGRNLLAILNDILDLSKIEAGKLNVDYESVLVRSVFDDIRSVFELQASERGITLETIIDPGVPETLEIDETMLRQILFNLVGNAVKFTHKGGVTIEVNVAERDETGPSPTIGLHIAVKDSGIGIEEAQLALIFEAFRQQEGQGREYGGTGLGLAITKRLVEMMNGRITVTSKKGVGSCFEFTLCGLKPSALGRDNSLEKPRMAGSSADGRSKAHSPPETMAAAIPDPDENAFYTDIAALDPEAQKGLADSIHGPLRSAWEAIGGSLLLDEWLSYGHSLVDLGERYRCPSIVAYGTNLANASRELNVQHLRKLTGLFPSLLAACDRAATLL